MASKERIEKIKIQFALLRKLEEEEKQSFLKSRFNKGARVLAIFYFSFFTIIFLDWILPGRIVNDVISQVEKKTHSAPSRHSANNSETYWILEFEVGRKIEMEYSRYEVSPKVGDSVQMEFSLIFNQPKSIYSIKSKLDKKIVSSVFSSIRFVIYSFAFLLAILFLLFYKRAYSILVGITVSLISMSIVLFFLTILTK